MVNNRVEEVSAKYLVDHHSLENGANEGSREANPVPVGYKQTEVGVIPEDWEISYLQDIAAFGGGTTPARRLYEKYYVSGTHPWVKTLDLNNSFIHSTEEYVTDLALNETSLKKHPRDSVLVAMYGGYNQIGRTGLIKVDAAINQALVAVIPKRSRLLSEYLLYNLNYNVDYWKGVASSSRKDPNITSNDIKKYCLPVPRVEEQTAIAIALSDVDTLISSLESLIAKKQAIKTATMQQLLTGRTRLPQFALREDGSPKGYKQSELGEVPEDWGVSRLKEIANVDPENLGATTSLDYEFDYISLEQVSRGNLIGTIKCTFRSAPSRARRVLMRGDVLVSTVRPNLMSHYYIDRDVKDLICSTGFSVVRPIESKLNPAYFYQHLFGLVVNSQVELLVSGSNYPAINSSDVRDLKIQLGSLSEQTAIATILSDMDQEIQTLEQRLNKTRQIKQGMMQQLLTGKIRLVKPEADAQ